MKFNEKTEMFKVQFVNYISDELYIYDNTFYNSNNKSSNNQIPHFPLNIQHSTFKIHYKIETKTNLYTHVMLFDFNFNGTK
jgi:hypothetical protein